MRIGAVEAGGTKFVCGLFECATGNDRPTLLAKSSIPTTTPGETLGRSAEFFRSLGATPEAFGIGSFGPVELDPDSPRYGRITSTPKPGWRDAPVAPFFRERFGAPVAFDTDVNAAALGESLWGAATGLADVVYVTVGTGIGGGVLSGGVLVHGRSHPELGHVRTGRLPGDAFPGVCPFHGDCLEGLASGPAIAARWGAPAETLGAEHPAWDLEAGYLGRAFAGFTLVLSPRVIILGGGVGMRAGLAEAVEARLRSELAGYVEHLPQEGPVSGYVRRPGLGHEAGLYGGAALAMRALADRTRRAGTA